MQLGAAGCDHKTSCCLNLQLVNTMLTYMHLMLVHAGNVFLWDQLAAAPGQLPPFFQEVARPATFVLQRPAHAHAALATPQAAAAPGAVTARGAEVLSVLAALARDIIGGEVLPSALHPVCTM